MIHIVFSEADKAVLEEAILLDESLQGDIQVIGGQYQLGPIAYIHETTGRQERASWWQSIRQDSIYQQEEGKRTDDTFIEHVVAAVEENPEESLWVWVAQNARDVAGYYWLLQYCKKLVGRFHILLLQNLPFLTEKGAVFYPNFMEEIRPSEFLKAKKLAREITPSELEIDPDEWTRLQGENKGIRILDAGKKLKQYDYDHFDKSLETYVTDNWQKANKIISHHQSKEKESSTDEYLFWRLNVMIAQEMFDVQGKADSPKTLEIKNKAE